MRFAHFGVSLGYRKVEQCAYSMKVCETDVPGTGLVYDGYIMRRSVRSQPCSHCTHIVQLIQNADNLRKLQHVDDACQRPPVLSLTVSSAERITASPT